MAFAEFDRSKVSPSGDVLTGDQREVLAKMTPILHALQYDGARIKALQSDLIQLLVSACQDSDAIGRMYLHPASYVRWRRLPGYWLAYFFQLVTLKQESIWHVAACDLLSDAQAHQYDDLAISSLENAYVILQRNQAVLDPRAVVNLEGHTQAKLKSHFRFYSRWCKPFDYRECNTLAENPYSNLTFADLRETFPALRKGTHGDPAGISEMRTALLGVVDACSDAGQLYHRVVARRCLANVLSGAEQPEGREQALGQYEKAIIEARDADLDAELGHLYRQYGCELSKVGRHEEAIQALETAYGHDGHPVFAYWRALDARELGDAWLRRAARTTGSSGTVGSSSTNLELEVSKLNKPLIERSLEAYRAGRLHFQEHMLSASLPIARAIKLQMFRQYTENAIQVARILDSGNDVLAELEMYLPHEAAEALVIIEAAGELGSGTSQEVREKWAVFHRHLNTLPDNFEDYLKSIPQDRDARQQYMRARLRSAVRLAWVGQSDSVVKQLTSIRISGVNLLLFFVGPERSWAILWMGETGTAAIVRNRFLSESSLREAHQAYLGAMAHSNNIRDPRVRAEYQQAAVGKLLDAHATFLGPLFEGLLPYIRGHHLKIFPVMHLNAVPMHAIPVGGRRLIDWCDVSYCQSLGLFMQLHARELPQSGTAATLGMVYDDNDKIVRFFEGIVDTLSARYQGRFSLLRSPGWQELRAVLKDRPPNDLLFACHGEYDAAQPAASRLKIAGPEGLSFSTLFGEIELPRLRSVTMGACQSGLGRAELSSEYIGLPNVFLSAGVRYVVGSLWTVNVLATALLLGRLFELLADGGKTMPVALNCAQREVTAITRDELQLWVRERLPNMAADLAPEIDQMDPLPFAHPYFWAGFYASGDV